MKSSQERIEALFEFDSDCLEKAQAVLAKVNFLLTQYRKPVEIRALVQTVESAQRIGRLALGASTENIHTQHDRYTEMSDEELAAELERLGIEPGTVQ